MKWKPPTVAMEHLDFVLSDPSTTAINAAIELDDKSHNRKSAKERDAFVSAVLATASIPLLRIPVARQYDVNSLRIQFGTITHP